MAVEAQLYLTATDDAVTSTQVVATAFCYFISAGARLSTRYDAGGSMDGRLRGLYPGWLFGRRMVHPALACCPCQAAMQNDAWLRCCCCVLRVCLVNVFLYLTRAVWTMLHVML